jgi:hypothetical protein
VILLWGCAGEGPFQAVADALDRLGGEYFLFDQRDTPDASILVRGGRRVSGWLRTPSGAISLEEVTGVFLRPHDIRRLPAYQLEQSAGSLQQAMQLEQLLFEWIEVTPALVINKPSAMASNNCKPYQSRLIERCGLRVPRTLITTSPADAEAFWRQHQRVVYKSISGIRSIVSQLTDAHRHRLSELRHCPTQLQEYIDGDDYRVHVVGEHVSCCKICCGGDDYRYAHRDGVDSEMTPCAIPGEVAQQCRAVTRALGLTLSGIDLRRRSDGSWYCFEVNPSPGFTCFDEATAAHIAEATAQALMAGSTHQNVAPERATRPHS